MSDPFAWRDAPEADFAVIGDPIKHSLSPAMHSAAYEALGLPFTYVAIHVPSGEVVNALSRLTELGYRGVNVTVPHKEEVLSWAKEPDEFAIRARAANTLDLKTGKAINTDAPGFLDTISDSVPKGSDVLMLGAGGSARAIAIALVEAGFKLRIQNRTHSKAAELAGICGATAVESLDPRGAALIVNTTSASLSGQQLDIPWANAEPSALAYDLAYGAEPTPFMQAASQHGLQTLDGRDLLVAQGALSFEWWLHRQAPRAAMRSALK